MYGCFSVGQRKRFFGEVQFADLFPGFSNKLFHNATPAQLYDTNCIDKYKRKAPTLQLFHLIKSTNVHPIEAIEKSFTRDLFDSYGNNQKLAASNPLPFHPFRTVISHRKKKKSHTVRNIDFGAEQNKTKNLTLRPVVNGWKTTANSL